MSEGPGGPQGATAGGTLAMRMLSQQAMVASQMKRAANDKAIAQMLAAKKSGPPAARLGDEIQHKSFLGALAGAVLGAIVTIAEGCLIMAACATGPYALVLVPALMYASYKASDYVEEKQNQLESWINSFCDTDGAINTGSENVKINGKPAARAAVTLPPPPQQRAELCPQQLPAFPQQVPQFAESRQILQFSQQSRWRQKIAGYRYSPQDHSLPRRELRLDIQIGHLLTANKDVRRTSHDCCAALQFVALACGRLIVDKDVAAALGYPRWFVLLVAERRVLTGFREIHIFFDFATPAHHGGKLH